MKCICSKFYKISLSAERRDFMGGTIVEARRIEWRLFQWVMQKNNSELDKGGNHKGGEKWSDLGYICFLFS